MKLPQTLNPSDSLGRFCCYVHLTLNKIKYLTAYSTPEAITQYRDTFCHQQKVNFSFSMKLFCCCCVWSGQVTSPLHPDVTVLAHISCVSVFPVGGTGCVGLIKRQWAPKEPGPSGSFGAPLHFSPLHG